MFTQDSVTADTAEPDHFLAISVTFAIKESHVSATRKRDVNWHFQVSVMFNRYGNVNCRPVRNLNVFRWKHGVYFKCMLPPLYRTKNRDLSSVFSPFSQILSAQCSINSFF